MKGINEILGDELTDSLRDEFNELLDMGGGYDDVEDLMLSYGLEMDYLENLLF